MAMNPPPPTPSSDIGGSFEITRKLGQQIDEVMQLLKAQQDMLRKQGMNLPIGSMDALRSLKARMDNLRKQLSGTQTERRALHALAETAALINSSLEVDEVLNQVMDTVIKLTGAERGYIVLKNRSTGALDEFRVARGMDEDALAQTSAASRSDEPVGGSSKKQDFIVSRSIVNDVAASGEPVLTSNAIEDERYQQKQSIVGYALRSILAVPLKVRGELIGVVYCDNRIMAGLFQQTELELLTAFSNQAAVAIENARLFEDARAALAQVTQMQALLDNIFESIASGVITTDEHWVISRTNANARAVLGVETAQGQPLKHLLPLGDEAFADLESIRLGAEARIIELADVPLSDGRRAYLQITASVLNAIQGQGQGLALVVDDLTEQKAREAQLAEVKRYLPTALVNNIRNVEEIDVGGQERQITAVFADVRGFTAFSENLEPEVLMQVINKYLSVASDAINLYGGIVDKYLGDAVTGLFNTQLNPQEDHALFAVQAAFSILYDVKHGLHEVLPEDQRLIYGIGVHTGMAVLGNVGSAERKEFAALGEATEICKVLQESARGDIVVSPQTYGLISAHFEGELIDLKKTKGALTQGYRIIGRKRGTATATILVDPELADLLKDLDD